MAVAEFVLPSMDVAAELALPTAIVSKASFAATDILWDRIVSIEYIGYEQVYDIEVEGTHNFVANGIIAHNTYINGALTTTGAINSQTIGATSTLNNLNVSGALNVGGGYGSTGITMSTDGNLQVDGNIYLKGTVWRENLQELLVKNNTIRLNSGGSSQDAKIEVEGTGAATLTTIQWNNTASNWSIDKGLNITSGSVGIGTTGPLGKLDVNTEGVNYGGRFMLDGTNYNPRIKLYRTVSASDANYHPIHITNEGGDLNVYTGNVAAIGSETVTNKFVIKASGNVGIGITSPDQKLQVAGVVESTSGGFKFPDGTTQTSAGAAGGWTDSGTNVYVTTTTDNVGIGTTGPLAKLHVSGNIINSTSVNGTGDYGIAMGDGYRLGFDQSGTRSWTIKASGGNLNFYSGDSGGYHNFASAGVLVSGNVGIGTTGPGKKLEVVNAANDQLRLSYTAGSVYTDIYTASDGNVRVVPSSGYTYLNGLRFNGADAANTIFQNTSNLGITSVAGNSVFLGDSTLGAVLTVKSGNVGINTTAPEAKLDVVGPLRVGTAGDVNIAHDLYFEDITSANIKSYGPLTIQSGNPNSNYNLVLKGTGTGKVIVDDDFSATGNIELGDAVADTVKITGTVIGASPALIVDQASAAVIADFRDSGTSVMTIADGGNVGIGTTAPGTKLQVASTTYDAELISLTNGGNTPGFGIDSAGTYYGLSIFGTNAIKLATFENGGLALGATYSANDAPANGAIIQGNVGIGYNNPGTAALAINGNVGIGTTGPSTKLDVYGTSDERIRIRGTGGQGGGIQIAGASGSYAQLIVRDSPANGDLEFIDNAYSAVNVTIPNLGGLIVNRGNVGIGTTGPDKQLEIWKSGGNDGLKITASATGHSVLNMAVEDVAGGQTWTLFSLHPAGTYSALNGGFLISTTGTGGDVLAINSNGNVGIGTTNPQAPLEIYKTTGGAYNTDGAAINFNTYQHINGPNAKAKISVLVPNPPGDSNYGNMDFQTVGSDGMQKRMTIQHTGNVGIGTTNPGAYKLNVNGGDMYVSGNITAGGTIGGVNVQTIGKLDLTPEFPTAVLKGTGSGIMTSTFDTTAGNYHNYYNWTGNSANQSYDIYIRVLLPEDFGTWDSSAAISYYTNIDGTPGNSGVTLTVYDTNDNVSYTGAKIQTAGWLATTVGSAALTGTYADGDWLTLKFTMTGDSGKNAKLGEVVLKYNRE